MNLPGPETLWNTNAGVSVALVGPKGNIHMQGPVQRRMKDNIALAAGI
jgi:hypothetical protein